MITMVPSEGGRRYSGAGSGCHIHAKRRSTTRWRSLAQAHLAPIC